MCPYGNRPDCFNCSLPDCKASVKEVKHQEAIRLQEINEKRDNQIVEEYRQGVTVEALCKHYNMSISGLYYKLDKAGIPREKKRRKKRGQNKIS